MKLLETCKLLGISMLLVAGLAACDKPGPAETAGRKIDQTAENAGRKMGDVADSAGRKMGDAADSASRKIGETADKVGEKLSDQSAKTGVAIDDAEITARVKAAIFAEPGLRTLQISVDTVKAVVTLSGSVDSLSSSDRAKQLAGAVAGVKEVENRLVPKASK